MADSPLPIVNPEDGARKAGGPGWSTRRFWAAASLLLLGFALLGVLGSGVLEHLSWADLRGRRLMLKALVARHPFESFAVYVVLYGAMVALSLPGALLMTLAGGVLFGAPLGAVGAVTAVSGGSMVMFMAARTGLAAVLRRRVQIGGLLDRVEAGVRRHAFYYILFLRLMPAAPIWLVNVSAGLVRAPPAVFVLATVIGVAPSTVIYAWLGSDLDRTLGLGRAPSLDGALHPSVWLPLVGLACLALLPVAADRLGRRV